MVFRFSETSWRERGQKGHAFPRLVELRLPGRRLAIQEIHDALAKLNPDKGWDAPLHVDGASGLSWFAFCTVTSRDTPGCR